MAGGIPPALLTTTALIEALDLCPSRTEVGRWVHHWGRLDDHCGHGHTLMLEEAMFNAVSSAKPCAFRAAWTLALLTESGVIQSSGLSARLFGLLNGTESLSVQREILRALLMVPWSRDLLDELTQWALHVVFLDDMPVAVVHHSLKVMERRLSDGGDSLGPAMRHELRESLSHVVHASNSVPAKKKAALLLARLSE